ncbi:MAG TPA: M56 family metallopeptidase [Longimicrobium sp.]|nr:M56 family metallopeptidase [Longimicrobium sp.]
MIAHWMVYCVAVGTLLSGGALAMEKALRPLGRPTRWVWAGAVLLTLALPAAARALGAIRPGAAGGGAALVPSTLTPDVGAAPARRPRPWLLDALDPQRLQTPLAALWAASSAAAVLALAGMAAALHLRRRAWAAATVDGVPVLVSADVGPAVVGLLRSRIVLPRWAVDADRHGRALVLEHEQEHVRAGDPRLLAAAVAAAVLTPWNPAVWWQLRRLRLAVEVDCDARVLRRRADVHAYGSVLLEVGRRASRTRLAAAFAEPVSTLERRIRIMTAPRVRRPLLRAAGFGTLALALAAAACEAPMPTMQPSPSGTRRVAGAPGTFARSPLTPRALLEQYYPQVLHDGMDEGEIIVFVLNAQGGVVSHDYLKPAGDGGGDGGVNGQMEAATGRYASQIGSVNVIKALPGEMARGAVRMVLVQLKDGGASPSRTGGATSGGRR